MAGFNAQSFSAFNVYLVLFLKKQLKNKLLICLLRKVYFLMYKNTKLMQIVRKGKNLVPFVRKLAELYYFYFLVFYFSLYDVMCLVYPVVSSFSRLSISVLSNVNLLYKVLPGIVLFQQLYTVQMYIFIYNCPIINCDSSIIPFCLSYNMLKYVNI